MTNHAPLRMRYIMVCKQIPEEPEASGPENINIAKRTQQLIANKRPPEKSNPIRTRLFAWLGIWIDFDIYSSHGQDFGLRGFRKT
jgi:hypothetical protein